MRWCRAVDGQQRLRSPKASVATYVVRESDRCNSGVPSPMARWGELLFHSVLLARYGAAGGVRSAGLLGLLAKSAAAGESDEINIT